LRLRQSGEKPESVVTHENGAQLHERRLLLRGGF
jgi:hypothetical protein